MTGCAYTRRYAPPPPEVPEDAVRLIQEASRAYEQRQRAAREAQNRRLEDITETARARVREVLGADNWRSLREFLRAERLAFHDLLLPPEGLTLDFAEANRTRKDRSTVFLEGLGASPERLREIGREFFADARDILSFSDPRLTTGFTSGKHLERWHEIRDHLVRWYEPVGGIPPPPPGSLRLDPHRFFDFRPPFDGFQTGWAVPLETGGFRVACERALDPSAGLVGHDITLDIDSAGDVDAGCGTADTQVSFMFQAPAAGLVEVVILAQCGLGRHELRTEDEWGWSESSTTQRNFLMMHVVHPNVTGPSFAEMSHFPYKTDASRFEQRENIPRGRDVFAQLFSDGPVPAGDFVEIRAGTRSHDCAFTNDVEIHSRSSFRWFLKSVLVRIAP